MHLLFVLDRWVTTLKTDLIHVTNPTKMRLYKILACILLILSIFSAVLPAPVAVQEIREACANAVDGSVKRAVKEDSLFAQAQQEPSSSDPTSSQRQGSSAPNYVSWIRPSPSFSPGESVVHYQAGLNCRGMLLNRFNQGLPPGFNRHHPARLNRLHLTPGKK